jgi:cytochrome c oxidase assembly factor CtaG
MIAAAGPYAWEPHLATWAVLVVAVAAVILGHRRLRTGSDRPIPWTRTQKVQFAGSAVAAAVVLTWPVADLAAHWSLTALVFQRVVMVLVVAPLLLLGFPYDLLQWLTRPPAVDAVLVRLQRPPVAIVTVTVLMVGSMTVALVHAQSHSALVRLGVTVAVLVAGLVLWLPVLGRIPGILRLKPVVRFGYLVAQAVVPAFLSFIYIFSTHPLYAEFAGSHRALGLRPLNDQQIAGFLSKLSMLFVLLIVGAVVLARAPRDDEELAPSEPLVWADVERQFERVDRRSRRRAEVPGDSGGAGAASGSSAPPDGPGGTHAGPPEDDGGGRLRPDTGLRSGDQDRSRSPDGAPDGEGPVSPA